MLRSLPARELLRTRHDWCKYLEQGCKVHLLSRLMAGTDSTIRSFKHLVNHDALAFHSFAEGLESSPTVDALIRSQALWERSRL